MRLVLAKAAVAVYGFCIYWVGGWTLCDKMLTQSTSRDVMYTIVGLCAMLFSGTLPFHGGVDVTPALLDNDSQWSLASINMTKVLTRDARELSRLLLSMAGAQVGWLGMYSFVDYTLPPKSEPDGKTPQAYWKYVVATLVGCFMLLCTGSLLSVSGLAQDEDVKDDLIRTLSSTSARSANTTGYLEPFLRAVRLFEGRRSQTLVDRLFHGSQAVLSMIAQTLIFYGIYSICLVVPWCESYSELSRMVIVTFVGLALVTMSDSFVRQSRIEVDEEADTCALKLMAKERVHPRQIRWHMCMLYVKSYGVLIGSAVQLSGVWVLLDKHVNAVDWSACSDTGVAASGSTFSCLDRNLFYMCLGVCMVVATHTFEADFGVRAQIPRLFRFPSGTNRQLHVDAILLATDFEDLNHVDRMLVRTISR